MNAKSERLILRWVHLILSVPIFGFIYGPVADNPRAALATRLVFVPLVTVSGLWMWKGPAVRRWMSRPAASRLDARSPRNSRSPSHGAEPPEPDRAGRPDDAGVL